MRNKVMSQAVRPRSGKGRRSGRRSFSGTRGLNLERLERRLLLAADMDFMKAGVLDATLIDPPDRVDAGLVTLFK